MNICSMNHQANCIIEKSFLYFLFLRVQKNMGILHVGPCVEQMLWVRSWRVKYDLGLRLPALNCQVLLLRVQNERLGVCGHQQAPTLNSQPPLACFLPWPAACFSLFSLVLRANSNEYLFLC